MYIEDRETVLNLMPLAWDEGELSGAVGGIVVREKRVGGWEFLVVEAYRSLNKVVLLTLLGRSWRGRDLRMCNRYISNSVLVGRKDWWLELKWVDRML
jgi:hypothetical protein